MICGIDYGYLVVNVTYTLTRPLSKLSASSMLYQLGGPESELDPRTLLTGCDKPGFFWTI